MYSNCTVPGGKSNSGSRIPSTRLGFNQAHLNAVLPEDWQLRF